MLNVIDVALRDRMIEANRHLCRRAARRFLRRGLDVRDLEQVAAIGLIKASHRYDHSASTPFAAYAWVMIVGELMHHVRDHEHAVRIPRRLRRLDKRCAAVAEELTSRLGREPSAAEVAKSLGVSTSVLSDVGRARNVMASGNRDRGERSSPYDACVGLADEPPASHPEDRILAERALSALQPLERTIVLGVYALGLTQREIAQRLRLATRRVHRVHRTALARMHGALAG